MGHGHLAENRAKEKAASLSSCAWRPDHSRCLQRPRRCTRPKSTAKLGVDQGTHPERYRSWSDQLAWMTQLRRAGLVIEAT